MPKVEIELDGEMFVVETSDDGAMLCEQSPTMPWHRPQSATLPDEPCWCGCDCESQRRSRRERQAFVLKEQLSDYECLFAVYPTCKAGCSAYADAGYSIGRPGILYGKWLEASEFLDLCLKHAIDGPEAAKIPRLAPGQASRLNRAETFACPTDLVRCQSHSVPRLRLHNASQEMLLTAGIFRHMRPVNLTGSVT